MEIKDLQNIYQHQRNTKALVSILQKNEHRTIYINGFHGSSVALFASDIINKYPNTHLFILNDLEEAGYFYHDLLQINGEQSIFFFPSSYRRSIKYGLKDSANEILRTEVLTSLVDNNPITIITYPEALCEQVISHAEIDKRILRLELNMQIDLDDLIQRLINQGFEQTDYVYEPGQFALRGSIFDVFSFSSEMPYRIDLFGDRIDSIRTFDIENQLSKFKMESITIVSELQGDNKEVSFFDYLSDNAILWIKNLNWVCEKTEAISKEIQDSQGIISSQAENRVNEIHLTDTNRLIHDLFGYRRIDFGHKAFSTDEIEFKFNTSIQPLFHKNFDLVANTFIDLLQREYAIYICSDNVKQIDRLRDILKERGDKILFHSVEKTLHEGFIDHDIKICVFTDHQIFDRFHKYNLRSDKARSGKIALSLKELNQFEPGDYVVHMDHGIGRFAGLVRMPNGHTTQEMIKLEYQNGDTAFVSIHALHKLSKYKGKDGESPRISKLGTGAWEKIKERTKSQIKDIARDLIRLYSQRKQEAGFKFSTDSFMQHELEAGFLYEDTPDQFKATQDVKSDMESEQPMDRLICGDVGFGKTEVAVRAAFKAVADNKQVAVLVPTTVLAYQHYQTFCHRLEGFPCKVDYLSRARSAKDISQLLKQLADGTVNIIVGTHKLIGKNVKFKDLGLLIIDEEQKFGVAVKEKLRQLKVNIDTLTLTATPIPRTLQFSLIGARDLSVIQTPPPNRYPIQTEIHTFNEEIITDAINFEMSRNGQVFFINNRVQNLQELKAMILRNIPDCRVCIGHGQMQPKELERVITDFVNFDFDVLLATTIIESGIDIPNANTIIINEAHHFGLSDLHQMRGRVGRSNKKAFCYLLAPPLTNLSAEARRRLQAIENFSDLGSGIHIAMQDLDIRGAGNMLGAEQSGFIADLGYETYQKILSEAVSELKNEEFSDLYNHKNDNSIEELIEGDEFVDECLLESDLELLFPANYIPTSTERMSIYRELDRMKLDREVNDFRHQLEDRFGKIPPEGEELIRVVALRRLAKRLGIERIVLKTGKMILNFVSIIDSPYYQSRAFGKVIAYATENCKQTILQEQNGKRRMVINSVESVKQAVRILQMMSVMPPIE